VSPVRPAGPGGSRPAAVCHATLQTLLRLPHPGEYLQQKPEVFSRDSGYRRAPVTHAMARDRGISDPSSNQSRNMPP